MHGGITPGTKRAAATDSAGLNSGGHSWRSYRKAAAGTTCTLSSKSPATTFGQPISVARSPAGDGGGTKAGRGKMVGSMVLRTDCKLLRNESMMDTGSEKCENEQESRQQQLFIDMQIDSIPGD